MIKEIILRLTNFGKDLLLTIFQLLAPIFLILTAPIQPILFKLQESMNKEIKKCPNCQSELKYIFGKFAISEEQGYYKCIKCKWQEQI